MPQVHIVQWLIHRVNAVRASPLSDIAYLIFSLFAMHTFYHLSQRVTICC
jgi:hypothetical protein